MSKKHEIPPLVVKSIASKLNCSIRATERIGGGGNGKVYKLTCQNSTQYVAKIYFSSRNDSRDRLGVEYQSFQFLWEHGVRNISQPFLIEREHGYAIYEYIEGKKITPSAITNADIQAVVEFLTNLKRLASSSKSRELPSASEACFSAQEILKTVENRLVTLQTVAEEIPALKQFLENEFLSAFDKIMQWSQLKFKQSEMLWEQPIEHEKSLNPSDFGFHNALRRDCGEIVFLDFEYFGWDDPAKMICDFLLHPATDVGLLLKKVFVSHLEKSFKDYPLFKQKIEFIYPLVGLNWCLRLLNEFLPDPLLRRKFASVKSFNQKELQMHQLAKSKLLLEKIASEYRNFPYTS